jgi:flagellar L-ring protein precursor FlgH
MKAAISIVCISGLLLLSGCSSITGMLRPDLDDSAATEPQDQATRGGLWAERGMLDEEPGSMAPESYGTVGHHDRSPAEYNYHGRGRSPWISGDQKDINERDRLRGRLAEGEELPSYRNNPQVLPPVRRQYKNGMRATRADFVDETPNEGSLWASDGQTNYYFTKNRVRGMGDIITITIEDPMVKDIGIEVTRTLSQQEKGIELAIAQEKLRQKATGGAAAGDRTPAAQAAPARGQQPEAEGEKKEAKEVEVPRATMADVDITQALGVKPGDTFMSEIVQRYPNGNYKVRGTKRIPYRGGSKLVSLLGVVKGTDITDEENVTSGKLYEYRVEVLQ